MNRISAWHLWLVKSIISGIAAVVVPIIANHLDLTESLKDEIFIGISTWVVAMIFQISYSINSLHVDRFKYNQVLDVINENDCRLQELQNSLRQIASRQLSGRPNRVFIDYCSRNLLDCLNLARHAAQRGELKVHDHHFRTIGSVLSAFDGSPDRTFRCVWLLELDEALFDEYWRQYMKSIVELSRETRSSQRVGVRILFVVRDKDVLEKSSVKTVLSFVKSEREFDYHLMTWGEYRSRLCDGKLAERCPLDFGVYGDHLLFRTITYDPDHVGIFSDDRTDIQAFSHMHDDAMNATESLITRARFRNK